MKTWKNNYLLGVIKPYKYLYAAIVILTVVNGFLASFNIVAIFPLLNSILPGSTGGGGALLSVMQNFVNILPIKDPMLAAGAFLLLAAFLSFGSSILLECLIGLGSSNVGYSLKDELFKKYASINYQFFVEHKHGELFYYLFTAPQSTMNLFILLPQLTGEFIHIIFLFGLLFALNLKFTLFILGFILLFNAGVNIIARHISYNLGKTRKALSIEQQITTNEFISGIKHITLYLAKPKWIKYFDSANTRLRRTYLKEAIWLSIPKNMLEFSMYLFIIAIILLNRKNALLVNQLPAMAIYLAACVRLLPHITNVGKIRMMVMRQLPDAEATQDIISQKEPDIKKPTASFDSLKSSIVFRDVHFSYKNRPPILKGLNFAIEAMKTTAIVGGSGSGKTTIINLLLKLLNPAFGQIMIDNTDLSEYTDESWLGKIALVSQEPFIFHSTIKDNIAFGDERFSMDEIMNAAKIAYADEFVKTFPEGYETIVGEKGMKLSTGQQQRIAIARAMIRDPQILIFDEATNALDNISEEMIQRSLNEISGARTVIIIAHRLSSIRDADKIIMIKDGRKVEEGSHEGLINAKQHYWRMYNVSL